MNRLDELAELNLKLICKSISRSMYDVRFLDLDGQTELWTLGNDQHKQLAEYLEKNGLINRNGENCLLTIQSENICNKGWIEYLKSESSGNLILEMEKNTIQVLNKLMDGQSFTITKDRPKEIMKLIPRLENFGVINKVDRFKYAADFNKRKHLSKLIELGSWTEFLNWLDEQNTDARITNDFSGSTIGQVNQSDFLKVSKSEIKQTSDPAIKEKQQNTLILFIKKFWWQILIPLIIGVVLIMIKRGIINIGI